MAVTSIWPIKVRVDRVIKYACNPEKTHVKESALTEAMHQISNVAEYAADGYKTEKREFVTGINCTEVNAVNQFIETKKHYGKMDGRLCYHGYQSFAKGEVDAKTAHAIGVELAKRLWGERFEVLVATHCNTDCYHNHFVINSVSFKDGMKFYNSPADYKQMKTESDRLCLEHGLSILEVPTGKGRNYKEYSAEKSGLPTLRSLIRADIDRAIAASLTFDEFFEQLYEMGYRIKTHGERGKRIKYPGLKPPGAKGYFRFHKLGSGYDLEDIGARILNHNRRNWPFPEEEQIAVRRYRREKRPKVKLHGFYALYIRYCFELGVIRKFPASVKRVPSFLREDLIRFDRLDEMTRLLGMYQIETMDDLNGFREATKAEIEILISKRQELRNKAKREIRAGGNASETRTEIIDISSKIKSKRHELDLADTVEERSRQMFLELKMLGVRDIEEPEKEETKDELLIGRSRTSRENDVGGN